MKLIENNKDIKLLVTLFYGKLLKDELMAPSFFYLCALFDSQPIQ